jgi:microcystin-dependent protein
MAFPTYNPDWATDDFVFSDGTDNKVRPTSNLRQFGYTPESFPTAQEMNWMFNNFAAQIAELKAQVAAPSQVPVGMVIELSGTNANPNTLFGYGTWTPFGAGRVTIGSGSTSDVNGLTQAYNEGSTGGEYTHKLTQAEMPAHTHNFTQENTRGSGSNGAEDGSSSFTTSTTQSTGGNQSHNNVQPYIVVNKWLRVS